MIDETGKHIRLEVDGGVNVGNIGEISAAGIDTFVAGSAIFGSDDYSDTISRMKQNAG
jgi:ribulose-phosphate 3-epimerase